MPSRPTAPLSSADAWLRALSSREIAWLMVRLREYADAHTWVAPELAEARIGLLRRELHARRQP
jgi:hypothetical protein